MKKQFFFFLIGLAVFLLAACDGISSSEQTQETNEGMISSSIEDQMFTISWVNYDGSILETNEFSYGQYPTYNGEIPFRESTNDDYFYIFYDWNTEVTPVYKNKTYKASFIEMHNSFKDFVEGVDYSFFDSNDLQSFGVGQGWFSFTDKQLLIRTESYVSIYEFGEEKINLIYSFDMDSSEKGITDMEIDSKGNIFLLGYHIPGGGDGDTYLPGFILEINSDFSGHTIHDIDNQGMRVPREFFINENNEFGIIGEGSSETHAYMQHSFMIFDENYQKEYSYELNNMIRGEYRRIISKGDSFIIAGLVGDSASCSNSDCMDPIVQEFNSSIGLINEVIIEYDYYDDILSLSFNSEEIIVMVNNDYRHLMNIKLDSEFNIIYNEEVQLNINDPFLVGGIEDKGIFYGIIIEYDRFIFLKVEKGLVEKVYVDKLTRIESNFDRGFYLYAKLLVSNLDE
ncbi:hypothetical protein HF295_07250 [Hujiaoplasma nucleasis]|uniref:Lipoprotein n=1 Tax=Hujiaoplasma nucleasis TaxID=2725268 RepID=A0A7L6N510_9MOLU|nr:hypothetical protein [Hujiaoplasma nucleasis]QLY40651.1 hypothetical protein HF295_07250 [Hujiaoplasma nucleasis]